MELTVPGDGPCAICRAPGRACSGCYSIHYCGKKHQLQDWQQGHKDHCAPYKISRDPTLGRYLSATRDIPAGTFIMRSQPLALGPQLDTTPVCLGCLCCLSHNCQDWISCCVCGWPLCSEVCQKSSMHQAECKAMADAGFQMTRDCPRVTADAHEKSSQWAWYGGITALRCLLLPANESKKLLNLQSHYQDHLKKSEFALKQQAVANFIRCTMKLDKYNEEDIGTILAIFDTNAFEVYNEERGLMGRALYHTAAMMAHSCHPNARLCYVGDEFEMGLMAERDILKGSSINITYMNRVEGTLKRLAHLRATKCFDCTCTRCADPTDLGLYLGSIRCSKCRDAGKFSLMISTSPTSITADWKCQDKSCNNLMSAAQMLHFHRQLQLAKSSLDKSLEPERFKNFLSEQLGPQGQLHKTSAYVLQIKTNLIFNIYNQISEMTDDELNYKREMCEEMIEIANILQPGFTKTRGYLLSELHTCSLEWLKRSYKQKTVSKVVTQEKLMEAQKLLWKAESILQEPRRKKELNDKKCYFEKLARQLGFPMSVAAISKSGRSH